MAQLDQGIINEINSSENTLADYDYRLDRLRDDQHDKEEITQEKYSRLNWRQRTLGTWCGLLFADKYAVQEYLREKKFSDAAKEKADNYQGERDSHENHLKKIISLWYLENDERFKRVSQNHDRQAQVLRIVYRTLEELEEADDAIDSAQYSEMADIGSKNQGMSMVSYWETQEAKEEVEEAADWVEKLNDTLKEYQEFAADIVSFNPTDLSLISLADFAVDIAFDFQFDFLSAANLMALNRVERQVESVYDDVEKIRDGFQASHRKSAETIEQFIQAARDEARRHRKN